MAPTLSTTRFIDPAHPLSELARGYLTALLDRDRLRAADLIQRAIDGGLPIREIYQQVFQPVQYEVGWLWQTGRISVGHEHYCTNATQLIISTLYPRLFEGERGPHRLLATCVPGELHELGLRVVADFFEMEGWTTDFMGANTPIESVVRALEERPSSLLAVGVTMPHHLEAARQLVGAVRASRRIGRLPILVGGHAFNAVEGTWRKVGADGTAASAQETIALATRLVEADGAPGGGSLGRQRAQAGGRAP